MIIIPYDFINDSVIVLANFFNTKDKGFLSKSFKKINSYSIQNLRGKRFLLKYLRERESLHSKFSEEHKGLPAADLVKYTHSCNSCF